MAGTDYFLTIDGVDGEIELTSFSFGVSHGPGGSGAGAGKLDVQDLRITKLVDKTSPNLFQACATGTHLKSATIIARKAGGDVQVEYLFSDGFVSSYNVTGNDADIVQEAITLNFGKIEIKYT
jgi:type VI secretion system secreted protein Hcp